MAVFFMALSGIMVLNRLISGDGYHRRTLEYLLNLEFERINL